MNGLTRRGMLATGAGTLAAAVAGCLGGVSGDDGGTTAEASFFVLGDFAAEVAGDAADAETLVPVGQHGHGWEPSGQLQRNVLTADAFVYMGEGFQPWADDVVANVERDDEDVEVVAARRDVDHLPPDGSHDGHDDRDEHDGENHDDGHDGDDHGDGSEDHDDGGHDHGDADPHFWLDPTRAATAVGTIADGFAAVDPDNESAYRDNAAAYRDRLAALDDEFEAALSSASRDAVLVAGHNSFQYMGRRYGFEVHALTSVSPDDSPSQRDIGAAQEIIERHGIDHVLAPTFEADRAAELLVEDTDASEVLPITPIPGRTEAWADEGWGYVEVQEHVNLPSLRTALGAE
ncbi:metal ABC transporter substrate-binding protein [Halostella litorea]|uniref:metal ABC transporter substrate-binding protein n=1 Tax=Halostella litorea TaxID=2528831 RepID=UPI001092F6E5|nr:zinc ABC transporter substrate-binding protein [Halostella litorea]